MFRPQQNLIKLKTRIQREREFKSQDKRNEIIRVIKTQDIQANNSLSGSTKERSKEQGRARREKQGENKTCLIHKRIEQELDCSIVYY
jgi:hypothetical protein